jgi:hypothetical protein
MIDYIKLMSTGAQTDRRLIDMEVVTDVAFALRTD